MKKLTFRMAALAMALIAAVALTVPLAAWAADGDGTDGLKATGSELSAQKKAKKKKKKEAKALNPLDIGGTLEYFRDELKDDAKEIKKIRQAEQLYKRMNNKKRPASAESQAVWQTDAAYTNVTVEWGVPGIASDENAEMLQWRVSWAEHGGKIWSKPVVLNYNIKKRECTIKGLAPGHSYDVRVGYRYKNKKTGGYVNVAGWRKCTVSTFMTGTGNPKDWKYIFYANAYGSSYLELVMAAATPTTSPLAEHMYIMTVFSGPKFDTATANYERPHWRPAAVYLMSNGYIRGSASEPFSSVGWDNGCLDAKAINITSKGSAVATFGVSSADLFPGCSTADGWRYSAWQKKTLVADPMFELDWGSGNNLEVRIPNLKYANSYTVFIMKGKNTKSGKTNWSGTWYKAGAVHLSPGDETKYTISRCGKEKLNANGRVTYAVKVITNTSYGDSQGTYWKSE